LSLPLPLFLFCLCYYYLYTIVLHVLPIFLSSSSSDLLKLGLLVLAPVGYLF
jgi:hypothetical protein